MQVRRGRMGGRIKELWLTMSDLLFVVFKLSSERVVHDGDGWYVEPTLMDCEFPLTELSDWVAANID